MKNLSAHDEKASNQNLRAQRPMLRPKKSSQKPMKPTKTERITKYRRPEMRTKQATDGARDGAAETSRLGT
jgi:putative T-box transcription factor TBX2